MYDYAENGWQQHESGLWFKQMDVWWGSDPEFSYAVMLRSKRKRPLWSIGCMTVEQLDAAWSAELKRRESLPLLDPDKWSKTEDQGYSVHPDGYRLSQCADDVWYSIIMPYKSLRYSKTFEDAKRQCETHARELKGLPPL